MQGLDGTKLFGGPVNGRMLKHYFCWFTISSFHFHCTYHCSFYFQRKRENVSKNRGKGEVQTCLKHEPLMCKILALISSKPEPKKLKATGPNMLKTWTSKEERGISSNMPKTRSEMRKRSDSNMLKTWVTKRRRILQISDFKPSQFISVFWKFCPCETVFIPWTHSKSDSLILAWLFFFNFLS